MIGIICNKVNDAQMLYSQFNKRGDEYDIEIEIFHARYTFEDRYKIEK
jgi:CRISPR-associated endonuclease/helicase Cas3